MILNHDNILFSKSDWLVAGLSSFVVFMIYLFSLAPTVTFEQSGALAVAGQHLGIGRSPGYPLWHLLAKLFIIIFGFTEYHGHPNPAYATNLMSAVFGALSCGLVALIVSRLSRGIGSSSANAIFSFVAALSASILFCVSPAVWSQSVITETHTLTLFCILLFIVSSFKYLQNPSRKTACVIAATFALALAQSHITALLIPSMLLAMLLADPRLCREFCVAAFFLCILPGVFLYMYLPAPWLIAAWASGAFLGIAIPLRLSPAGKTALIMLPIITSGMLSYAYLPLASLGNPPMQFGYAQTWTGFLHVITRGQYERISPANVLSVQFIHQLCIYARLLLHQFILPVILLGLLPMIRIFYIRGTGLKWLSLCLLALFMFSVALLIGINPAGDLQTLFIIRVHFIPGFAIWAIFSGVGFAMVLDWIRQNIIE